MTANRLFRLGIATALVAILVGGVAVVLHRTLLRPTAITAYFTTATAIYPGDEVRIAGVKVGTIDSIQPVGTQAKMTLTLDHGIRVPADAKAVIVTQNLVAARYVQLTPAYESGPELADGAVIPVERTAVPVEWNEVKEQLMRLATELGPDAGASTGSVGRFVDSAAAALEGNGDKLRQTISQLSGVGRILAEGSGNVVDTITNLATFVTALRDSNAAIVQFQNRFATLTSVVDDSRSDLDAALTSLSEVVGETTRFIEGTRDKTAEQIQRLAAVTQNLADHRLDLENVLHIAPHSIANAVNMFDPRTGAASGVFVITNMQNPVWFICGMIGALENVTAPSTSKLCAQYLGPGLRLANFNLLPFPFNPFLTANPPPHMLRYSEPSLMPGAAQPRDPEPPPAVSAYTGMGDVPPPPGFGPPPGPPRGPLPRVAAPTGGPPVLQDLLLPAERPHGPADAPPPGPPSEGTPP
ncbi:MCE family protein [Mycolicibacterium sp. XJ1819]